MTTSNPAFANAAAFAGYHQVYGVPRSQAMTVQGTVGKTFGLLAILSATAIWSWTALAQQQLQPVVIIGAVVGSLVLSIATIARPQWSPWTAPVYAGFEGVVLGGISFAVEVGLTGRGAYPGIALQAVATTAATLLCMLLLYTTGAVRVTERLRAGILSATGAIALVYAVSFLLRMFGVPVPFLRDASPLGIGISLVIAGVAAFNLLLDFDFVERGARSELPRYMEWYGAFGLMVTLVWLYLEILRLLQQLQSRDNDR